MSFNTLHYLNKRATPDMIQTYKHALLLHKVYNNENDNINWIDLFFTQNFNNLDRYIKFFNTSTYKVGSNLLPNRFTTLNGKIELVK